MNSIDAIGFGILAFGLLVTVILSTPNTSLDDYPTYASDEVTCVVENKTPCVKKNIFIWTPQNVEKN